MFGSLTFKIPPGGRAGLFFGHFRPGSGEHDVLRYFVPSFGCDDCVSTVVANLRSKERLVATNDDGLIGVAFEGGATMRSWGLLAAHVQVAKLPLDFVNLHSIRGKTVVVRDPRAVLEFCVRVGLRADRRRFECIS